MKDGAHRIGARLAMARKRRQLTLRELAAKAGVSCETARAVEAGNLQTGLGAYLAILWAMGLDSEIEAFADPERDEEGKQLELARRPDRVRHRKEPLDGEFRPARLRLPPTPAVVGGCDRGVLRAGPRSAIWR